MTPTAPVSDAPRPRRAVLAPLRAISGLILFTFALTHFLNHAAGLISIDAMQAGQDIRLSVTRSLPGTTLLISAAAVHFVLGIAAFLRARTLHKGVTRWVQLGFGLLIPIFLLRHIIGTRGVHEMFGVADTYTYALWAMWPNEAANQAALMLVVWVHGCIGLHHWLNQRLWYRRLHALWIGLAVAIPLLAFGGFNAAGRVRSLQGGFANPFSADQFAIIKQTFATFATGYYALLCTAVVIWAALILRDRMAHKITVSYTDGPRIHTPKGRTLLEISQQNRIPHASVCGGRARCSTCRVRVTQGLSDLAPPSDTETRVLTRVGAPNNVRLACQIRPQADLAISTLLPANAAGRTDPQDRYHWGVEREVTILFADLRGFTKMSEGRLSFDVVFLLNQFLGRMAEAIEDSGGYVDKFMGDGIMAIFGMETSEEQGARQALLAARAMGGVLDALNQSLAGELAAPLQMGIGMHTGPAILGRIGASHRTEAAARITALGETVNLASRLESLTKDHGVQVLVSDRTLTVAALPVPDAMEPHQIIVRGISQPVAAHTALHAASLPG